ncbi:MAG: CPBP family intramembrane metalloprotease [Bacteroides sp.]|nr:CPBP family intramembrane metalloprotease [Bacteroides sp.]
MKRVHYTIWLAFVLWTIMFSPFTAPYVNFWWMMTGSALTLSVLATLFRPGWWREVKWSLSNILLGIGIAAVLWGIFWVGDKVSVWMFDFARPQVNSIYGMKEGESPWLLAILMLVLIGPAEEVFWRGYVQRTISEHWKDANMGAVVTTAIYALVHAGSCNFMLIMAALVAGAVWGALYRFFLNRFAAIILSHSLWDVAVFIFFPI